MIGTNRRCRATFLFACALSVCSSAEVNELAWSEARQLLLVTTPDWDANQGVLQAFAWTNDGWRAAAVPVAITIGSSGLAWGEGLHPRQSGRRKKEGDGRSPAGVFRIGEAFGYAASLPIAMQYHGMNESDYCVDVSTSKFYNQIVDARVVGSAAVAGSTEPMRRDIHANGDARYKIGFVIEHNANGRPGAGSCIFAHIWKASGESTAGCTAMDEEALRRLLEWLRPGQHPIMVQLPIQEYARLKKAWRLPDLTSAATTD